MIQTYGRVNPVRKIIMDFQSAFKVNQKQRELLQRRGMDAYVPKLKKKFYIASIVSVFIASPAVPMGFVGVPIVMKWGLK